MSEREITGASSGARYARVIRLNVRVSVRHIWRPYGDVVNKHRLRYICRVAA
jgi:hypothetical protein